MNLPPPSCCVWPHFSKPNGVPSCKDRVSCRFRRQSHWQMFSASVLSTLNHSCICLHLVVILLTSDGRQLHVPFLTRDRSLGPSSRTVGDMSRNPMSAWIVGWISSIILGSGNIPYNCKCKPFCFHFHQDMIYWGYQSVIYKYKQIINQLYNMWSLMYLFECLCRFFKHRFYHQCWVII